MKVPATNLGVDAVDFLVVEPTLPDSYFSVSFYFHLNFLSCCGTVIILLVCPSLTKFKNSRFLFTTNNNSFLNNEYLYLAWAWIPLFTFLKFSQIEKNSLLLAGFIDDSTMVVPSFNYDSIFSNFEL